MPDAIGSETQNGLATVFGIQGEPLIEGYVSPILETAKAVHKYDMDTVKNAINFDVSLIATNGHIELDFTWCPSGTDKDAAAADAIFLKPLQKVELSGFDVALFNGRWLHVGDQSLDLTQKHGKMMIKLRKYDDEDQNNLLTKTVG